MPFQRIGGGCAFTSESARRFADVLGQLDVRWDLYETGADAILDMLPEEFARFRHGCP